MDNELLAIAAMREAVAMAEEPLRTFDGPEARQILKDSGWSAESAARVLGVSVRSVMGWLASEHEPSENVAGRWQKLLSLLHRASIVRSTRLEEGVERLLAAVRTEAGVAA